MGLLYLNVQYICDNKLVICQYIFRYIDVAQCDIVVCMKFEFHWLGFYARRPTCVLNTVINQTIKSINNLVYN